MYTLNTLISFAEEQELCPLLKERIVYVSFQNIQFFCSKGCETYRTLDGFCGHYCNFISFLCFRFLLGGLFYTPLVAGRGEDCLQMGMSVADYDQNVNEICFTFVYSEIGVTV